MKKILTAWAMIEFGEENKFPTFHKTKKECIDDNTSYFGHPCDDPMNRAALVKCKIYMNIPKIKPHKELEDYLYETGSSTGFYVYGDDKFNENQRKKQIKDLNIKLKKLKSINL